MSPSKRLLSVNDPSEMRPSVTVTDMDTVQEENDNENDRFELLNSKKKILKTNLRFYNPFGHAIYKILNFSIRLSHEF